MDLNTWLIFIVTIAVVIAIPGPLTLLMINNTINQGMKKSLPIIVGGSFASAMLITISALGLGAIITASETLFNIIKYLGAAYLLYLGISLWFAVTARENPAELTWDQSSELSEEKEQKPNNNLLLKSFMLGITNPKDIVFFVAFLPQFINSQSNYAEQLLTIVVTWFCVDFLCKISYGILADLLSSRLNTVSQSNLLDRVAAVVFVAAGLVATI
ncbi:LysE family translocator [Colwellia psychrerythraea]|uniref:Lysine exporter protein (LYSE/YGGA) n=1 Tax=Colwellia psychrerythraea TaxID=28229 RepID=A0A099L3V2_COLPS|nr:LysE family translocator [Colwellia psychrerythraea]KGJ96847.1 Lysine exporter protein (LYSE/YGGA) [Colwellia psychrerythraea]